MNRQAAFIDAKKHLKGALHCHTTRSDGRVSPEETIKLHAENGYDFMALTDHRYYNYTNFSDVPMTIIPGMEMDANLPGPGVHCHHIVCVGPAKEAGNGFEQDMKYDSFHYDDPAEGQTMLDWIHEHGNMSIYCHPEWSGTPAREFEMLRGNFAMEIWNSGCAIEDRLDMNAAYWDELLAQGQKIYGVATDDGHAKHQHCKGWVMVNSENNIPGILSALKNGAFYSSCGPEIYDFHVEKGVAHIECSPVAEIKMVHLRMPYRVVLPAEGETHVTSADVKVLKAGYVRACVLDDQGRRAWTNPIFMSEEDWGE